MELFAFPVCQNCLATHSPDVLLHDQGIHGENMHIVLLHHGVSSDLKMHLPHVHPSEDINTIVPVSLFLLNPRLVYE